MQDQSILPLQANKCQSKFPMTNETPFPPTKQKTPSPGLQDASSPAGNRHGISDRQQAHHRGKKARGLATRPNTGEAAPIRADIAVFQSDPANRKSGVTPDAHDDATDCKVRYNEVTRQTLCLAKSRHELPYVPGQRDFVQRLQPKHIPCAPDARVRGVATHANGRTRLAKEPLRAR